MGEILTEKSTRNQEKVKKEKRVLFFDAPYELGDWLCTTQIEILKKKKAALSIKEEAWIKENRFAIALSHQGFEHANVYAWAVEEVCQNAGHNRVRYKA